MLDSSKIEKSLKEGTCKKKGVENDPVRTPTHPKCGVGFSSLFDGFAYGSMELANFQSLLSLSWFIPG